MAGTRQPPGLRFHPTDIELVKYYLKRKVLGKKLLFQGIFEIDIYKHAPWDLPDKSGWRSGDLKWYFFCPREKKYASGARMNRSTDLGYWKTTGKDRSVSYNNEVVGMIKTLVFHRGKAPKGERTDWVMYEYRLQEKELAEKGVAQDAYVLCAIFKKDGPGPRNGAQYGAPFREEDWNEDDEEEEEEEFGSGGVAHIADISRPSFVVPVSQDISLPSSLIVSGAHGEQSLTSSPPQPLLVAAVSDCVVDDNVSIPREQLSDPVPTDEIGDMLRMFSTESASLPHDVHNNEVACPVGSLKPVADPYTDGISIYDGLGDLGSLVGLGEPVDNTTGCNSIYPTNLMVHGDDDPFMELTDLELPLDNCATSQGHSHLHGFCSGGNLDAPGNFVGPSDSGLSSYLVNCSTLPPQMSGRSCMLHDHGHLSNKGSGSGGIANTDCDIYDAGSYMDDASLFDGSFMPAAESEQLETRGRSHHPW